MAYKDFFADIDPFAHIRDMESPNPMTPQMPRLNRGMLSLSNKKM